MSESLSSVGSRHCRTNFDCPGRQNCFKATCICNYELLFYGDDCQDTSILMFTWTVVLLTLASILFFWAAYVFFMKWKFSEKWNYVVSTSFCAMICSLSALSLFLIMLLQCLNIGKQHILYNFMQPILFSVYGGFLNLSLLHVSCVWIELATAVELSSYRSLARWRKILIIISCLFFSLVIAIFFVTSKYIWVDVICCIYAVMVVISFTKGSFMISKKLNVRSILQVKKASQLRTNGRKVFPKSKSNLNLGLSKHRSGKASANPTPEKPPAWQWGGMSILVPANRKKDKPITLTIPPRFQESTRKSVRKVILCSRCIAIHCALFCLAGAGAIIFDSPPHKYIYLNCVMVCVLNGMLGLLRILLYLTQGLSCAKSRRKPPRIVVLVKSVNPRFLL